MRDEIGTVDRYVGKLGFMKMVVVLSRVLII